MRLGAYVMKWRLFMGLILCGACVACVTTKAPSQFIVPAAPALARSNTITTPPDQSDQKVPSNSLPKTAGTETAEAGRGDVLTLKSSQPESRLIGCIGSSCAGDDNLVQGSGRYLQYKRTSYIGYLPMRTAFFVVQCANEAQGEELYYLNGKWCLASGAGIENECYEKQYAMKMACAQAENIELK